MINVHEVLPEMPHFDRFCSVEEVNGLAERLRDDPRFEVNIAGSSVNGVPIYHVRFGEGSVKALFPAGPHAMEPVGMLTVFSLMTLLHQGNRGLVAADVEWHFVPCIDPDGAIMNEGWTLQPFTLESYVQNFWAQPRPEQVDFSFPVKHKKLRFEQASKEAQVLKGIIDQVMPDFYYSLHDYSLPMGGTWFALSHDIGEAYYQQIYDLLKQESVTLQPEAPSGVHLLAAGMRLNPSVIRWYDHLEAQGLPIADELLHGRIGASSHDHLEMIKPSALSFTSEIPHGQHPWDASQRETGQSLRQLRLRLDADNKFLATVILEEWDKAREDLEPTSPHHRKILRELIEQRDRLHEGITEWYVQPIQTLLFDRSLAKPATEAEVVDAYNRTMLFLCNAYSFVRLLMDSRQSPRVREATARLEHIFQEALKDVRESIHYARLEVLDCDRVARVQLGAGLIALNSVLAGGRHGS